jgi:pimeloyl-ACP methyl ester carboxylesterase
MREIAEDGISARVYGEPALAGKPAVVVFDGSGGGYPTDEPAMAALAAVGYPTLAVAYFRNRLGAPEGVPAILSEIPLEYGIRSVRWAEEHLGGQSHGVVVMGHSRGSELALLVATRCPNLRGVVAISPSDAMWQSNTFGDDPKSAWSEAGQALPFRRFAVPPGQWPVEAAVSSAYVEDVTDATIPVERIGCPVLLISSRADRIWPSAKMADAICDRMGRHGRQPQNLQFDDASHILMGFGDAPVRVSAGSFSLELGGSEEGTRTARNAGWEALLGFLQKM